MYTLELDAGSSPPKAAITGEFTVCHAADIHRELVSAMASLPAPLELDLSGVTDIDSAGLQLLLVAVAAEAGAATLLGPASHTVREATSLLGFDRALPFPPER